MVKGILHHNASFVQSSQYRERIAVHFIRTMVNLYHFALYLHCLFLACSVNNLRRCKADRMIGIKRFLRIDVGAAFSVFPKLLMPAYFVVPPVATKVRRLFLSINSTT